MEKRLLGRQEGRTDDNIESIKKRFRVSLCSLCLHQNKLCMLSAVLCSMTHSRWVLPQYSRLRFMMLAMS